MILSTSSMDWNLGPPEKHAIVMHLLSFRIASKDIVPIDSMVVEAIYGQHSKKSARHTHNVRQLGFNVSIDADSRRHIYTAFEAYKDQFDINDSVTYFKISTNIAKAIYNAVETIRSIGDGSFNTLIW